MKGQKNMKTQLIAVLAGGLLYAPLASAAENAAAAPADRITVFKAPLVCPAARQIGCGSASKPILLDLEQQPGVLEAWLNRAGTRIRRQHVCTCRHEIGAPCIVYETVCNSDCPKQPMGTSQELPTATMVAVPSLILRRLHLQ